MKAVIAGTESSLPPPESSSYGSGVSTNMILIIVTMIIAIVAIVLAIVAMFLPSTTTGAYVKSQIITVNNSTSTSLPGGNINGMLFYVVSSTPTKPSGLIVDNSTITGNTNFTIISTNVTSDVIVQLINFSNLGGPIEIKLSKSANQLTVYIDNNSQITYSVESQYPQTYYNSVIYYPSFNVITTHNIPMQNSVSVVSPYEIYLYAAPASGANSIYVAPSGTAMIAISTNTNLNYYLALYTDGIGTNAGYNYVFNNTSGTVNYGIGMKATFTQSISDYPYTILPGSFALIIYDNGFARVATTQ